MLGLLLMLAGPLLGQMQPVATYHGKQLLIVSCSRSYVRVQSHGDTVRADVGTEAITQSKSFGRGHVVVSNIHEDLDPAKNEPQSRSVRANHLWFRYKADVTSATSLKNCYAVLVLVSDGSIESCFLRIGDLAPNEPRHVSLDLVHPVDAVGSLHVFSNSREILSNLVTKPYSVVAYFDALSRRFPGVPAFALWDMKAPPPCVISDDGNRVVFGRISGVYRIWVAFDLVKGRVLNQVIAGKYNEDLAHADTVSEPRWISANEIAYVRNSDLMAWNIETRDCVKLRSNVRSLLSRTPGHPEVVNLLTNDEAARSELVRFDTRTRKSTALGWCNYDFNFLDATGRARLGAKFDRWRMSRTYFYRSAGDSHWRPLDTFVHQPGIHFDFGPADAAPDSSGIFGISGDGNTLYVSSYLNTDRIELASLDMSSGRVKQVIGSDPRFDMFYPADDFSRILTIRHEAPIGYVYQAEKPVIHPLDPGFAVIQRAIDARYPNHVNLPLSWTESGKTFVYDSSGDDDPGSIVIYRPLEGRLYSVFDTDPALKNRTLAKIEPRTFTSRDGTRIYGYLALPPKIPGENLPLVALIHDGPGDRISWGYHPVVQYLATRGYAVLMVNYRGSSGYGKAYSLAGIKGPLDGVILDDVADSVRQLVNEKVVDAKRIAVMGSGFGGWGAYMSLVKHPGLYRAGICIDAISNWKRTLDQRLWYHNQCSSSLFRAGLPTEARLRSEEPEIDPIKRVGEIRNPVLIIHGERDAYVSIDDAKAMAQALQSRHVPVEPVFFANEGYGNWSQHDNVLKCGAIGRFLRAYLAP